MKGKLLVLSVLRKLVTSTRAVVASIPPTLTTAVEPNTTPPGALNQTLPPITPFTVLLMAPLIITGVLFTSRFSTMSLRVVRVKLTALPLATVKLFQSIRVREALVPTVMVAPVTLTVGCIAAPPATWGMVGA